LRQTGKKLLLNKALDTEPAEKRERDDKVDEPSHMAVLVSGWLLRGLLGFFELVKT
jgi:hypothetical protein